MMHYALYKGDEFLDIGTAEQLTETERRRRK